MTRQFARPRRADARRNDGADADATQGSAFVDVVSNTLMLVLVLTLLLVVAGLRVAGAPWSEPQAAAPEMQSSRRELFPPWSRYYLVFDDYVVPLDLGAVAERLAADTLPADGRMRLAQGTVQWSDRRADYADRLAVQLPVGDVDAYTLLLEPDFAAIAAAQEPFPIAEAPARIAAWAADERQHRRVPGFFVYASGMNLFAELYPELQAASLRFRWTTLKESEPIRLYRSEAQFTSPLLRF
jgi:hypothetical protein